MGNCFPFDDYLLQSLVTYPAWTLNILLPHFCIQCHHWHTLLLQFCRGLLQEHHHLCVKLIQSLELSVPWCLAMTRDILCKNQLPQVHFLYQRSILCEQLTIFWGAPFAVILFTRFSGNFDPCFCIWEKTSLQILAVILFCFCSNQAGFVDCPLVAISTCIRLSVRVSINNVSVWTVGSGTSDGSIVLSIKLEIFCCCCWLLTLQSDIYWSCSSS